MKEIKTIIARATHSNEFDMQVNAELRNGWRLVRRDVLPAHTGEGQIFYRVLYAELERDVSDCEERAENGEV